MKSPDPLKFFSIIDPIEHLTSEFTGLRGFSRRSGGMMGWAATHGRDRIAIA